MFLSAWVLFCSLAIANLQRVAIPKESHVVQPQICNEHLINENFVKTTVVRGPSPQLEYCINQYQNETNEPIDLDQLIDLYKTFNFANSFEHVTPNSPITQSGVLSINDHQELPLFIKADIRHRHIRINPDGVLGHDADDQMTVMGQLITDDRACLLPHSIGGARGSNVVPMAQEVHQLPAEESDSYGLGPPLSFWRSNEDWIQRFLQTYPDGRVAWSVAVQYADGVVADPRRHRTYRPVGFALQFSAYKNQEDVNSLFYKSPQTTLLNNNGDPCGRNFRNHIPSVPSECRLPNKHRGVGAVMSNNVWGTTHVTSFPYTIGERTFFYGQQLLESTSWFIQELLPNGQMGEQISAGDRDYYYNTVFPFSINGKNFFYSHEGNGGTYWFIQELLPDGQMGGKTSDGNWKYTHHVSIPFTIAGKQYYYGQVESANWWYIQELLPDGVMGDQVSEGSNISPVVFVYKVNDRQFLYGHDPQTVTWHTRELLPGGTMGEIIGQGNCASAHHTSVPYSIDGQHFFFGQNLDNGHWFIQEILLNGHMGGRIAEGQWEERYKVVFAYVVNGRHFMYGHEQRTKAWVIRELL